VQVLFECGANVNAEGGKYGNALQAACVESSAKTVRMLLEDGAEVNSQGGEYGNPLQAACAGYKCSEDVVQLLLENGAEVNAQGGKYGDVFKAASVAGVSRRIMNLLWEYRGSSKIAVK
jgi:ankyrin repeat protein